MTTHQFVIVSVIEAEDDEASELLSKVNEQVHKNLDELTDDRVQVTAYVEPDSSFIVGVLDKLRAFQNAQDELQDKWGAGT